MRWKEMMWPWNRLAFLERQLRATEQQLVKARRERNELATKIRAVLPPENPQPLPKVSPDA